MYNGLSFYCLLSPWEGTLNESNCEIHWGMLSFNGIPYGFADFFFLLPSLNIMHFQRPNVMKETLYWPGILEKPAYR